MATARTILAALALSIAPSAAWAAECAAASCADDETPEGPLVLLQTGVQLAAPAASTLADRKQLQQKGQDPCAACAELQAKKADKSPEDPVMKDFAEDDGDNALYNGTDSLVHVTELDKPTKAVEGKEMSAARRKELEEDAAQAMDIDDNFLTIDNPLDQFSDTNDYEKSPAEERLYNEHLPTHAPLPVDWDYSNETTTDDMEPGTAHRQPAGKESALTDVSEVSDEDVADVVYLLENYLRKHKGSNVSKASKARRQRR